MKRVLLIGLAAGVGVLPGCMQRTIHITSDPSGAQVYLNDIEVGRTPVEVGFTYFGTYDVRLRKDGFEPLVTSAKTDAPMHEWPGFDLIAMAWPQGTETNIRWHFDLEPSDTDEDALLERARAFRQDFSGDSSGEVSDDAADEE